MKYFIYLRGYPGVGKITVARLLEKKLGYRLFWFHDLKNAVFNIVHEHRIPRLMDAVTAPVMEYLLERGDNVIYVRPSPDRATAEVARSLVKKYPDYTFLPVRLTASYDTLVERATERDDPYRICTKGELDAYLGERETMAVEGELIIDTDGLSAEMVAAKIMKDLGLKS